MPHFAKLDENNIVLEIQVFSQEDVDANGGDYSAGAETWVESWSGHNNWKQCSYNDNARGRYPGKGYSWDSANEKFKAPQPHASWTFNTSDYEWQPPITRPNSEFLMDGETKICKVHQWWNEDVYQANNSKGWVGKGGTIIASGLEDGRDFEWNGSAWVAV
tara:strand:+ start:228 stop:710 length:483 start_codon:yes stop_codon:yes gene_type:complete